jgi:hypothetical protein
MKKMALLAVIAMLALGCKSGLGVGNSQAQTENAVRAAIQDHLAHQGNLNLQAFDTDVKQVTIQGDQAKAEVEFRIKGGPGAMQLTYTLAKHDGAWSVTDSDVGSNLSHPGPNDGQGQNQGESSTLPGASHSLGDTLRSFGAGAPPATR